VRSTRTYKAVTQDQMGIQSSTNLSSVQQNEYILSFTHAWAAFYVLHVSLVTMFLPEDGPYEAEHAADYNNM